MLCVIFPGNAHISRIFYEILHQPQTVLRMSMSSSEKTLLVAIEMSLTLDKSREALLTASGNVIASRQIGLDKIIFLRHAYQAKNDTAAFAISIFDRWLALDLDSETGDNDAPTNTCECHAMACFLIAMKLREVESPALLDMSQNGWTPAHIVLCEQEVMFSLDWNVHSTTGFDPIIYIIQSCKVLFKISLAPVFTTTSAPVYCT